MRTSDQACSLGEITVGRGTGRGRGDLVTIVFPWAFQYAEMIFLLLKLVSLWRRSLEMACQRRTSFRCKRNKGIYYQKFRCNQEGGGVETGTTQEWHLLQGATGES